MRLVFVTPTPPSRWRSRSYNFLTALAPQHEISLVCLCRTPREFVDAGALRDLGVRVVPVYEERRAALARAVTAVPGKLPLRAAYAAAPRLMTALYDEIARGGVDLIHAEGLRTAEIVRAVPLPVVWDAGICSSRLARLREAYSAGGLSRAFARMETRRLRAYERELLTVFPHVLIASERERIALLGSERALRMAPEGLTLPTVVPSGIDLNLYHPTRARRHLNRIVFSGPLETSAGRIAIDWLLGEVMPRVWSVRPDVKLTLLSRGAVSRLPALGRDPRVSVAAGVDDARPYLAGAAVAVSPMPTEIGAGDDVLEVLAMGTPLVASDAAVGMLRLIPGRDALLADRPDRFAAMLLRVLGDDELRRSLGRHGRAYVERYHSWTRSAQALEEVYEAALGRVRQPVSSHALVPVPVLVPLGARRATQPPRAMARVATVGAHRDVASADWTN